MTEFAVVVALGTLAAGLALALGFRLLPTVRLQLAALALVAVALPLTAVTLSGLVMFHMHADVKLLEVGAASASTALLAALFLGHSIGKRVGSLEQAAGRVAAGDLGARAPASGPRELAVRVRNILRRTHIQTRGQETVAFGDIRVDAAAREVRKKDVPMRLTMREFDLLWFLVSHPRRAFSRDRLMDRVWGYTTAVDTGTVTVHIRRLREKIEPNPVRPRFVKTVWGVGYKFEA